MAHWFHRNPLKATAPVTYELRGGTATNGQAQKICSELRQSRNCLLDILSDPSIEVNTLSMAVSNYFGLLHGFITSLDPEKGGDSVLRHALKFRWTNTLLGNAPTEQFDAAFERISMLFNVALWYTKHACKNAGMEQPSMEEAKEVHTNLRIAAGIFTFIKNELVSQLIEAPEKGTDLDPRILDAYINQCTAEAQEVTIARAIELKHNASLVSALAYETSQMYTTAECSLKALETEKVALKWQKYLQFKAEIYLAYAYNYHGETLLAEDKCGEAIKCLETSQTHYAKATQLAKDYAATKGAGTTAKPAEHLFFRKLGPIVQRTLDKCVRENGFIYHQKVPPVVANLELKATYGLVAPEQFCLPPVNSQWTPEVYKAFDITKMPKKEDVKQTEKEKKEQEIKPVKEKDVGNSSNDPKTFSGCVVS